MQSNLKLLSVVTIVGLLIMLVKFLTWWLTNSNAILTDTLESIINTVAGAFAIYSLVLSAKPRDKNHPYGHGKIEFLSSGFEGALIFLAGGAIVFKALYNFFTPHHIEQIGLGTIIVGATGLVNYLMGLLLMKRSASTNSIILHASGKHLQTDAFSSLALVIGLLGLKLTDFLWIDNVLAIAFGIFILYTGFGLLRNSIAGIMDESDYKLINDLVLILDKNRSEDWIDVHNFRVIKYGPTLHIDCHITLPWYYNTRQSHNQVKIFERLIEDNCTVPVELFVHVDPCLDSSCRICQKTGCQVRKEPMEKRLNWYLDNIVENRKHDMGSP